MSKNSEPRKFKKLRKLLRGYEKGQKTIEKIPHCGNCKTAVEKDTPISDAFVLLKFGCLAIVNDIYPYLEDEKKNNGKEKEEEKSLKDKLKSLKSKIKPTLKKVLKSGGETKKLSDLCEKTYAKIEKLEDKDETEDNEKKKEKICRDFFSDCTQKTVKAFQKQTQKKDRSHCSAFCDEYKLLKVFCNKIDYRESNYYDSDEDETDNELKDDEKITNAGSGSEESDERESDEVKKIKTKNKKSINSNKSNKDETDNSNGENVDSTGSGGEESDERELDEKLGDTGSDDEEIDDIKKGKGEKTDAERRKEETTRAEITDAEKDKASKLNRVNFGNNSDGSDESEDYSSFSDEPANQYIQHSDEPVHKQFDYSLKGQARYRYSDEDIKRGRSESSPARMNGVRSQHYTPYTNTEQPLRNNFQQPSSQTFTGNEERDKNAFRQNIRNNTSAPSNGGYPLYGNQADTDTMYSSNNGQPIQYTNRIGDNNREKPRYVDAQTQTDYYGARRQTQSDDEVLKKMAERYALSDSDIIQQGQRRISFSDNG